VVCFGARRHQLSNGRHCSIAVLGQVQEEAIFEDRHLQKADPFRGSLWCSSIDWILNVESWRSVQYHSGNSWFGKRSYNLKTAIDLSIYLSVTGKCVNQNLLNDSLHSLGIPSTISRQPRQILDMAQRSKNQKENRDSGSSGRVNEFLANTAWRKTFS
jgi:hypothetical protein